MLLLHDINKGTGGYYDDRHRLNVLGGIREESAAATSSGWWWCNISLESEEFEGQRYYLKLIFVSFLTGEQKLSVCN